MSDAEAPVGYSYGYCDTDGAASREQHDRTDPADDPATDPELSHSIVGERIRSHFRLLGVELITLTRRHQTEGEFDDLASTERWL